MVKIYLSTPAGEIAIVKDKITAVAQCDKRSISGKRILSQIYVDGDKDPFNILEDFHYVTKKI